VGRAAREHSRADRVGEGRRAGRGKVQRPQNPGRVRPIIAATEEKAWQKAHDIVGRIQARVQANGGALSRRRPLGNPENTGSQRLLAIAEEGERFDRALWTRTAAVTGGALEVAGCLGFAASLPLAIWAATIYRRLRTGLGVTAPGGVIGLVGGLLAAASLGLAELVSWTSSQIPASSDAAVARALADLSFAAASTCPGRTSPPGRRPERRSQR
jgi:hypothetical protein